MQRAKKFKKDLYVTWIDYKKAFDSIPHLLFKQIMETFKIKEIIRNFIECSLLKWKTTMMLTSGDGRLKTFLLDEEYVRRLFVIIAILHDFDTIIQCSEEKGYIIHEQQISCLLYMEDLKLFAANHEHMKTNLRIVEKFSKTLKWKLE